MKTFKILVLPITFTLAAFMGISVFANTDKPSANAYEGISAEKGAVKTELTEEKKDDVALTSEGLFASRAVSTCEYLYNLDGSPDYIYTEFAGGGYAVYAQKTLELMEYSFSGDLPIKDFSVKNYYAGPANYLQKENNIYRNVLTGEKLNVSPAEAVEFAKQTREALVESKIEEHNLTVYDVGASKSAVTGSQSVRNSAPAIGDYDLIKLEKGGKRISNSYYFTVNPTHGRNFSKETYENGASGTCGPVAAQILLGYNNYYNNRNIIPDRFLNGYNDTQNKVTEPEKNPNYCSDPMKMTRETIGTRSEGTGENSFYAEMIRKIMWTGFNSTITLQVKNGIKKYLDTRIKDEFEIGYAMYLSKVESAGITKEIDADRPLIITTLELLKGDNHFMVGYGYQDYTYPNGEGTFSGYIVHYGHQTDNNIWINSSWCNGYISLKINHTHNYVTPSYATNGLSISKCSTCGHRTDEIINIQKGEYREMITDLPAGQVKEYRIKFDRDGYQVFQTFGPYGMSMQLLNNRNVIESENGGGGYEDNAFFTCYVYANDTYTLRLSFYRYDTKGKIKVGIVAPFESYESYDDIEYVTGPSYQLTFDAVSYRMKIIRFTPTVSADYDIYAYGIDDVDPHLYIVFPRVTNVGLYNDDEQEGDPQARIVTYLQANREYLILVSPVYGYAEGGIHLSIEKS